MIYSVLAEALSSGFLATGVATIILGGILLGSLWAIGKAFGR